MRYRILADLVVGVHLLFVVFVIFGGLLVLRWRWLAALHLPSAVWGVLIEFAGWICPLTPLENRLRRQSGTAGYEGGFIEHYILPLLYPGDLTRAVQLLLGTAILLINVGVYWWLFGLRQRRRPRRVIERHARWPRPP